MNERYSSVRYKVFHTTEPLHVKFPELFKHKPFQKLRSRPDCENIVRYIVALYDKNSQLVAEFQHDLMARKEEAAKDAGYKKISGKWGKDIQEIMNIQNPDTTEAIMQYLKIQRHNIWMDIVITEQELYEYQELRFTPIRSKKKADIDEEKLISDITAKKSTLMKACDERIKKLEGLYEQFFGDNKDLIDVEFKEAITPEKAERLLDQPPYEEIKSVGSVA